jgi:hypothetical protein
MIGESERVVARRVAALMEEGVVQNPKLIHIEGENFRWSPDRAEVVGACALGYAILGAVGMERVVKEGEVRAGEMFYKVLESVEPDTTRIGRVIEQVMFWSDGKGLTIREIVRRLRAV